MQIDCKQSKAKGGSGDPLDRCRKLTLDAKNEVDEALLALIARSLTGISMKTRNSRARLYQFLIDDAVEFTEPQEIIDAREEASLANSVDLPLGG